MDRTLHRLAAGLAALGLSLWGQIWVESGRVRPGLLLQLLAALAFAAALRAAPWPLSDPPVAPTPGPRQGRRPLLVLLLTVALGLGPAVWVGVRGSAWVWPYRLSLLAFAAVLILWEDRPLRLQVPEGAVLALLGLALLVRLWNLGGLPFGLWYDEADAGLHVRRLLADPAYRPVLTPTFPLSHLFLAPLAWTTRLLGEGVWALRLPSALWGALSVLALWGVARELLRTPEGRPWTGLALLALGFGSVARWSLTFSRFAMHGIQAVALVLLALWGILRGMRTGSVRAWGGAGLAAGAAAAVYAGARVTLPALLLYLLLRLPELGRRARWGLLLFLLGAWLIHLPTTAVAVQQPDLYWGRVRQTSIFQPGKPREVLVRELAESTRRHLGMFTVRGDANGRHNLPGAPMLDRATAALFWPGVALLLARAGQPAALLLLAGTFLPLLGGILAVPFEAPQAFRSVGAQPFTLLVALLPLAALTAEHRRLFRGRPLGLRSAALALLAWVALLNLRTYFVDQARHFTSWNEHSTPQTLAARWLREEGASRRLLLSSLFADHPTVRYLAPEAAARVERWTGNAAARLPLDRGGPRGALFLLDPEHEGIVYDRLRTLYPQARFAEVRPPFGGPVVLYAVLLDPEQIDGLHGVAWEGGRPGEGGRFALPEEAPGGGRWRAYLRVPDYGPHRLTLIGPPGSRLRLDGREVLGLDERGEGRVEGPWAVGLHLLEVEAPGPVRLLWDGTPLDPAFLFYPAFPLRGLLGTYRPGTDPGAPVAYAALDPQIRFRYHIPPLPFPFQARWSGFLRVPVDGAYALGTAGRDRSRIWLDGRLVLENPSADYREAVLELTAGDHRLEVEAQVLGPYSGFVLYWRPPGGERTPVPAEALIPPWGEGFGTGLTSTPSGRGGRGTGAPQPLPEGAPARLLGQIPGLGEPRGLAVREGILFVADRKGGRIWRWTPEEGPLPFAEGLRAPLDLAPAADGGWWVLEEGEGIALVRLDGEGRIVGRLGAGLGGYGARGIAAAGDGLAVADTGGGRILLLGPDGRVRGELRDPDLRQPADLLPRPDGGWWVVDLEPLRLLLLAPTGEVVWSLALPPASALDRPYLAPEAGGGLWVSLPEEGEVLRLDGNGRVLGRWRAPPEAPVGKGAGVAVDGDRLYLADPLRGAVWIWAVGP